MCEHCYRKQDNPGEQYDTEKYKAGFDTDEFVRRNHAGSNSSTNGDHPGQYPA